MFPRPDGRVIFPAVLVACAGVVLAQGQRDQDRNRELDRQFQAAAAEYEAGQYPQAQADLEKLLPYATGSAEVHELLAMVYAAQSQPAKAETQFESAIRINPDSAEVRTNYAATLAKDGKVQPAIEQLRKAVQLAPRDYDANHNLGELLVLADKVSQAVPFLKTAEDLQPTAYDNGYDLAMACLLSGQYGEAEAEARRLLRVKDTAELHNLLGQIDEKSGKFVDSVNEFQTAAHAEPSEDNLFDWGSELLLHRTYDPAVEVFQEGAKRYPKSPRMSIGLGMALYSLGKYDEAVKALLEAADLAPADPRGYVFLSKAYDSSPNQAQDVIERFRRYAELQPASAEASYYYAMSLWKGKRMTDAGFDAHPIQALLEKAITLDPRMPEAELQMGNLLADQHEYAQSIPYYQTAIALDANLTDAHYRLGQSYIHTGQKDKAENEIKIYQRLRAEHLAELDRERAEVRQFVYSARSGSAVKAQ